MSKDRYMARIDSLPREIVSLTVADPLIAAIVHRFGEDETITVVECLTQIVVVSADERKRMRQELSRYISITPITMVV
jgi:hypothetical protein